MDYYIMWAIVIVVSLAFWGIVLAISKYIDKHKMELTNVSLKVSNLNPKEELSKEFDRIFYGDLSSENKYLEEWDKIRSPMMIGYLCDGTIKYRHIMATLLNFIQKGYIEIIQIEQKENKINYKLKKKNLEIFNGKVYENIKTLDYDNQLRKKLLQYNVSASDIYAINRIIFDDNDEIIPGDVISFYDDEECEGKETEELKAKLIYLEKLINKEFEIYGMAQESNLSTHDYKGKLTNIGIVKRNEWLNFARKLKKETLISNRDAQGVIVWGEYMAYAVALNVGKLAISDIWDRLFENYNKNSKE